MNEKEYTDTLHEIAAEVDQRIAEALDRINISPPENTVAMAVAFQVAVDLLGEDAAKVTVAQFFPLFAELYRTLTKEEK